MEVWSVIWLTNSAQVPDPELWLHKSTASRHDFVATEYMCVRIYKCVCAQMHVRACVCIN